MNLKEVPAEKFIEEAALRLEKFPELKQPTWSHFVKTGVSREKPPTQKNWWYLRSASILRKISLSPGMGVNRLRKVYGGRKNRGHPPEHSYPASGAIIRRAIQQLESAGLLMSDKTARNKIPKRILTDGGREFIEEVSKSVAK